MKKSLILLMFVGFLFSACTHKVVHQHSSPDYKRIQQDSQKAHDELGNWRQPFLAYV